MMPQQHAPSGDDMAAEAPTPRRAYEPPFVLAKHQHRSQRVLLRAIRLLFMVLLVTVTLLPFIGSVTDEGGAAGGQLQFTLWERLGLVLVMFGFGVVILLIDALTPNKKLGTVFGIYLGIVVGLVAALAVGALVDLVAESWDLLDDPKNEAFLRLIKLAIGIALCYLAVSIVLTTKDDFRLVIPYVEFAKQVRGVRPMLMDSSALIDGRIEGLARTGFLAAPLIVSQFVVDELQRLADSSDKLKRGRGRRGLGMVSKLQENPAIDLSIDDTTVEGRSVDRMLLQLAADQNMRILTTDYNLDKVAQIQGVPVLNLNELANAIKPQVTPGETLTVEIVKRGESAHQGVGYLPDGTMVVVEEAADRIGDEVMLTVTNSLQTSAGRMIFGRLAGREGEQPSSFVKRMASAATSQPRAPAKPARDR